jgi:8-amino-7-oxononanoate synthase
VLALAAVRDHLIDAACTFIFDTGLTLAGRWCRACGPGCAGRTVAGRGVMTRAHELATMCDVPELPESAVVSVILGDPMSRLPPRRPAWMPGCGWVASARRRSGGDSRLRLTARAALTDDEMALARRVFAAVLGTPRP